MRPALLLLPAVLALLAAPLRAQEATSDAASDVAAEKAAQAQQARYEAFTKQMSGVKLIGRFTILGKEGNMPKEEYTITSVKKMPNGDYWLINARIKYGKRDLTLPLPLEVKWSGDTPVITLTDLTIPALGTFSSRVVIYNGKYAGTWTHGKVGGHLFSVVEKIEAAKPESKKEGE